MQRGRHRRRPAPSPTAPRSPGRCRPADRSSGTVGGTPYVEPCALLDTAAFEALGGPPPEPVVVDTVRDPARSLPNAASAAASGRGPCATEDRAARRSTFAVLEVRVAPDPPPRRRCASSTSPTATRGHGGPRARRPTPGRRTSSTSAATKRDPLRTRVVHVVVGRVRAAAGRGPRRRAAAEVGSARRPTTQLIAAIDALAEALSSAAIDVP